MDKKYVPILYFVIFFLSLGVIGYLIKPKKQNLKTTQLYSSIKRDTIQKFASDEDFIALMSASQNYSSQKLRMTGGADLMMKTTDVSPQSNTTYESEVRTSGTNVQVFGIDEPDIVKTDDSSIFYSKEEQYRYFDENNTPPGVEIQDRLFTSEIVSISALPPSAMKKQGSIPTSGEMLISGKMLVVFTTNTKGSLQLEGYSIVNPASPKKIWELPFSNKSQKIAARLYKNSIYLVTATSPNLPRPCPIPLVEGKTRVNIRCTDIYMPSSRPAVDSIYSVLQINPQTGLIDKSLSLVGQSGQTGLYMSKDSLYLSYNFTEDTVSILNQFIVENKGILPQYIEDKIKKLNSYDLARNTKEVELSSLLSHYLDSMDSDERLKQENELSNIFKRFFTTYKRAFEYTGIVKVDTNSLTIKAVGKVPGSTLNQFSFDEWKGDLRVATTIGGQNPFYMFGRNNSTEQVSDVYVLGKNLEEKGAVKDLGKTERIYSVRFIEDRGYVVTFRQTDPFYVLDLSDGDSPQLKGELKIPGYSSYLHPLDTHLILGIGRERQVKLSLFDVSDPSNPKEVSKYELAGEYWSEAMDNHHAFLQDSKYKIFFLPGSRGGYVLSYEDQSLSLVKALEAPSVKRGLYLNDYLYIVSDSGITAFKEGSWEKIGEYFYEPLPIELRNNSVEG